MSTNDESHISEAVRAYVVAMSTADEAALRAAFHPSASIMGNYQSTVEWLNVHGYVREVVGAGLPPNLNPNWRIVSIDVTNDAAAVKVEDEFGAMRFTDYLSLLKIDGEWKVVAKLYHLHA